MRDRQLRKHVEMERLFGADFLPLSRRPVAAPPVAAPTPPRRAAAEADPPEIAALREKVAGCAQCDELCSRRTQTVFGVGSLRAPVVFVGEAPGEDEDRQGEPFVGRAGQLLTKTLRDLGVRRSEVYIANILKCRPPGNRTPKPEEMANCAPYLYQQIRFIQPKIVCVMGNIAAQNLLDTKTGITKLRGRVHDFNGMRIFPTFHPAYILRNMGDLKYLVADLKQVCREAGLIRGE
ncbi:MAG: uracil-DNA glycosylase [Planctomycetes bacterium]|nr:uracil-DNA glycosylase [Planctomycetota bacterium]